MDNKNKYNEFNFLIPFNRDNLINIDNVNRLIREHENFSDRFHISNSNIKKYIRSRIMSYLGSCKIYKTIEVLNLKEDYIFYKHNELMARTINNDLYNMFKHYFSNQWICLNLIVCYREARDLLYLERNLDKTKTVRQLYSGTISGILCSIYDIGNEPVTNDNIITVTKEITKIPQGELLICDAREINVINYTKIKENINLYYGLNKEYLKDKNNRIRFKEYVDKILVQNSYNSTVDDRTYIVHDIMLDNELSISYLVNEYTIDKMNKLMDALIRDGYTSKAIYDILIKILDSINDKLFNKHEFISHLSLLNSIYNSTMKDYIDVITDIIQRYRLSMNTKDNSTGMIYDSVSDESLIKKLDEIVINLSMSLMSSVEDYRRYKHFIDCLFNKYLEEDHVIY